MQLTQYQKELLLKLLGEHDDKVTQQRFMYKDTKKHRICEMYKKEAESIKELIEMIEQVPTTEDMLNHLTHLADMYKNATFEERVKLYQEENAKACKLDILNYKGMTDIIMPTLYAIPVLPLQDLNDVKMEGEVDVYKATIEHKDK